MAVMLCEDDIDVNRTAPGEADERTVLHKVAARGHYDVLDALLTFKGEPALDVNKVDANGSTALHAAAGGGRLRVVKRLCSDGRTDATVQDRHGETALHDAAARQGRAEVIAALLAMEEEEEAEEEEGGDQCGGAGGGKHRRRAVDVNARSTMGTTALHKAMSAGLAENVTAILTAAEIDVNARDSDGDTALHEVGLSGWVGE